MYKVVLGAACFMTLTASASDAIKSNPQKPNIVFIMCDDLGYGEISALNVSPNKGKIATPHVDRLVADGMTFSDAHTGSSVCSPTRYGLLTGRYAWRTKLQRGVVTGHAPCLIGEQTLTIAEMLRETGYSTGIVGKWHLNYIYADSATGRKLGEEHKSAPPVNSVIMDGPADHGFDYFYGYHHSRDMETVCENNRVIAHKPPITMLPGIEAKSVDFIKRHAEGAASGKPFFLYVALSSPHDPIVPTEEWQGKSGLNPHADFVMQTDHTVGQIVEAVDAAGLAENTLIVFTSDNGTSGPTSKKSKLEEMGHYPSWILRGSKSDIWDGGHRVPFIARWTGKIEADSKTPVLICHTDFMATMADLVGISLPDDAAVDGFSYKEAFFRRKPEKTRPAVVHHSISGKFAIRNDKWKLVLCPGSGGWSDLRDEKAREMGLPDIQLYDMQNDISEQHNLQAKHPEVVRTLVGMLSEIVDNGRSTPGRKLNNDVENIDIWKGNTPIISGLGAVPEKPNILFILVDDLGKEWVSSCGAEGIETPNIDRLAEAGLTFESFYVMPQCTPSRVTLFTGQYPFRHGWINHWDVPRWGGGAHFDLRKNPGIALAMQSAGYKTAAAGKWQVNDFRVQPEAMISHGFDDYCMWTGYESGNQSSTKRYWDPYIHTKEGSKTYEGRFGEDVFTDFLINFMKENRDAPMFLYYAMCLSHTPFTSTPTEPDVSEKYHRHEAMVRYIDTMVGRLERALSDLGLRENTLIIFTTDNGTAGSITGRLKGREVTGGKAKTTENGICVPFIVNCPGLVPQGKVTDALGDLTDIFPTFVEIGGGEMPDHYTFDGVSLADVMLGRAEDSPREWILAMGGQNNAALSEKGVENQYHFRDRVIRDKTYKLFVSTERTPEKLVNLKEDPEEANNLLPTDDPAVRAALEKLWKAVEQMPGKDNDPVYIPLPPEPWDVEVTVKSQTWKK